MLFPSICAIWTTPMLFPSICAVWTTPRRCSLLSVPSGPLRCCSFLSVPSGPLLDAVLFYLCRLDHSSTLFPSICAVWTTPRRCSLPSVPSGPLRCCSLPSVPSGPLLDAVPYHLCRLDNSDAVRCMSTLLSVPSGQLWCCSLCVDSSICAVCTTLIDAVRCQKNVECWRKSRVSSKIRTRVKWASNSGSFRENRDSWEPWY